MSKAEEVMKIVGEIENFGNGEYPDVAGLFGFSIESEIDDYRQTGMSVMSVFGNHPDKADILEEMLVAICGWSLSSLKEKMAEKADYYRSL